VRATPEPFQSRLLTFLRGHTDVLQRLVTEMYARGLSTRDIEDAFRDITGHCLISASAVSELTDRLWEDYEAFTRRDLSGFAVEYLFLDAIYESLPTRTCVKAAMTKSVLGLVLIFQFLTKFVLWHRSRAPVDSEN